MRAGGSFLGSLCSFAMLFSISYPGVTESLAELQARFDREENAVRKAKLLVKLGNAQLEETRRAEKTGDYNTLGLTLEKYRDNVRAALEALKKQRPDAERHSDGYRQLEIHVREGIRNVDESLLVVPEVYEPPLKIVRQDLVGMDEELLKLLFPRHPAKPPAIPLPPGKQP